MSDDEDRAGDNNSRDDDRGKVTDGVLADAPARKAELEDDGDGEIQKEEAIVGSVAVEAVRDGEPHRAPGKGLAQD